MTNVRAVAGSARRHRPHGSHQGARFWPETNCYVDLWIELIAAWGRDPVPLLGLAAGLDWQIDHFTFLKPAPHELLGAAGIVLQELALWDDTERQVAAQVEAGAVPILEVDAFFLPDTEMTAYQTCHTKTTIGISAIDTAGRTLEYFHNAGRFDASGDDYDGVLGRGNAPSVLFPYAEVARLSDDAPAAAAVRREARIWMADRARTRIGGNPVSRFASALPSLLARVGGDAAKISALCFNTTRQLGGTAELLADHLDFLGEDGTCARRLAERTKTAQFLISRSARRGRPDPGLEPALSEMADLWREAARAVAQATRDMADQLEPV